MRDAECKWEGNLYKLRRKRGGDLYKLLQQLACIKNHSFSMGDTMLWFSQIRFISLFAAYSYHLA